MGTDSVDSVTDSEDSATPVSATASRTCVSTSRHRFADSCIYYDSSDYSFIFFFTLDGLS